MSLRTFLSLIPRNDLFRMANCKTLSILSAYRFNLTFSSELSIADVLTVAASIYLSTNDAFSFDFLDGFAFNILKVFSFTTLRAVQLVAVSEYVLLRSPAHIRSLSLFPAR